MAKPTRNPNARRAYEFIKAHRREYPIETMCQVLDVAPSGYYEWLHKPISDRALGGRSLVDPDPSLLQGESRNLWRSADISGPA
jgi:hypothetical protein